MSKRLARTCIAAGCRGTLLLRLAEARVRGRLVILSYHRVLPADRKARYFLPDLVVTSESFRRQCLALRRHYDVLPLREAVEALQAGRAGSRALAAVTFDDGYRDNFRYALPILDGLGLRATFFVVAGLVGTNEPPWYDRLGGAAKEPAHIVAEAKCLTPLQRAELVARASADGSGNGALCEDDLIMDWGQLARLADQGHEIGSHSIRHEMLTQLDDVALEAEVAGSRRILENGLGRPVRSFCYPNGDVDDRVASAVKAAGYRCAVTVEPGFNAPDRDVYRLKRWFIHEGRLTGLRGRASGTLLRMELCGLADRVFGRRQVRADLP